MNVRDLVGGEVSSISPSRSVREAAALMANADIGALAVEVDGRLSGIITERDVLRACADETDLDAAEVADFMTTYPDAFTPEMSVREAADWLLGAGYRHLPVVDEGNVVGMVSIKDVLWAVTAPSGV